MTATRYHDRGTSLRPVLHDDYVTYLRECAARWAALGETKQANSVLAKAEKLKNPKNCSVCSEVRP